MNEIQSGSWKSIRQAFWWLVDEINHVLPVGLQSGRFCQWAHKDDDYTGGLHIAGKTYFPLTFTTTYTASNASVSQFVSTQTQRNKKEKKK